MLSRESGYLVLGLVLIVVSLYFRARRTALLVEILRPESNFEVTRAMTLGYLLDLFLPFRVGQIVRGIYQSTRLKISLLYSLTSIAIERSLDVFVVSAIFFLLLNTNSFIDDLGIEPYIYFSLTISIGIWIFLSALFFENKKLLTLLNQNISIFNVSISDKIKKSIWTTTQNLKLFMDNKETKTRYFQFFLISWICLSAGIVLLAVSIDSKTAMPSEGLLNSVLAVILSTVRSVDLRSIFESATILENINQQGFTEIFFLLQLPVLILFVVMSMIQLIIHSQDNKPTKGTSNLRYGKFTPTATNYINLYFNRDSLARHISKSDVFRDVEVLEFFKGSSAAATMLINYQGTQKVRKIIKKEEKTKLQKQHTWLKYNHRECVTPQALNMFEDDEIWGYDQEFLGNTDKMFNIIHKTPVSNSMKIQRQLFSNLPSWLYTEVKLLTEEERHLIFQRYVENSLFSRLDMAALESDDVRRILEWQGELIINGETYSSLHAMLHKLESGIENRTISPNFTQYSRCHGDLTIDNILISTVDESIKLIDPSDDNAIKGPIIDISRYLQSLSGGYEFSLNNNSPTQCVVEQEKIYISYLDNRSIQYSQLEQEFLHNICPKILSNAELEHLDLFTSILFFRMIRHRIRIDKGTSIEYLAKGIVLLNKYLERLS